MEIILILVIPALISAICLIPFGASLAAGASLAGNLVVLVLSIETAVRLLAMPEIPVINDWIACDSFGALILVLTAFVGFAATLYSWGYLREDVHYANPGKIRRYYSRLNLFLLSMLAIPLLSQLALVWIAVELTTLLSAFLVSFDSTPEALEAAWKYVVLTCMGAALALIGILILYWGMNSVSPGPFTWAGIARSVSRIPDPLLITASFFILIGFGAKVGLVPLHTWLPDAHSQAPAPICALLSGIETTSVLYVIMRLFSLLQGTPASITGFWFVLFGLISTGVAAFLLLQAKDYKRLFAFSTVENMGIILIAAGLGGYAAHFGATLQILSHSVTKSLCFFSAGITMMVAGTREISSIRGLIRISPIAGVSLMLGGLAIAGAPPLAVFLSEFAILKAGISLGQYLVSALLAIFIAIAFFGTMLQVNKMVFGKPLIPYSRMSLPKTCIIAIVIMAVPVIVFGFYLPEPLFKIMHLAASSLGR